MMSWLRELQILTMLPQIWLYMQIPTMLAATDMVIFIPTEMCIAIHNRILMAAIIIDNARNYIPVFKIWQTHATNIHIIRVH